MPGPPSAGCAVGRRSPGTAPRAPSPGCEGAAARRRWRPGRRRGAATARRLDARGRSPPGAGEGDARLHAAGELGGVVGAELRQARELQQLLRRGRGPVAGGAVDLQGEADVSGDAAPGGGAGAGGAAALGRGGRRAVYLRLAAGGPQQAADDAEERGLTAAAGADHRDELAPGNVQGYVRQRREGLPAGRQGAAAVPEDVRKG